MKLFLKSKKNNIYAEADYDVENKTFTVLKGADISHTLSSSEKFRGLGTIIKSREGKVKDNILQEDVAFKSASTAANFVLGKSTNGLRVWKNEDGVSLGVLLKKEVE